MKTITNKLEEIKLSIHKAIFKSRKECDVSINKDGIFLDEKIPAQYKEEAKLIMQRILKTDLGQLKENDEMIYEMDYETKHGRVYDKIKIICDKEEISKIQNGEWNLVIKYRP